MKRYLTSKEINSILSFVKNNTLIPPKTSKSLVRIHKNKLKKQLQKIQIYPDAIPSLKEELEKQFLSSFIQPGESVGIVAAQSIGQKNTQSTLNTFHRAGQAESQVLTGVPRFQELLNATKSPKGPSCKIFIKEGKKDLETVKEIVGSNLFYLDIKSLCKDISIHDNISKSEFWYEAFQILYGDEEWYKDFTDFNSYVKLQLDITIIYKYKISLVDIVKKIHSKFMDSYCVFSPENIGEIHIYFDTKDVKLDKEVLFINEDNYIRIYLEETVKPILLDTHIFGIKDIENIYFYKDKDEWIIDTDGSSFNDILHLKFVDPIRTLTNNIWEIYETLGIEATKNYLIEEFENIIEVNPAHIKILVSRMTFGGTISSISRYTMRKEKTGPISKSSFEETVDQFIRAACNSDVDDCSAVSSSIVCGNRPNFGTGMVDLKVDISSIMKHDKLNLFT